LVGTLIFTVLLVAARHNCQSQQVETEYECQNFFHGANVSKKFVCLAQNCRVALVRLGKIKCAAKVGRLMGGFAALFILRRDSQTALPKIALSVGFCLAVRVALSDRVADNVLQLQEVGDFGDENCLPALNLIRSTKLHLTTEPPISCRCCYHQWFFCLSCCYELL
jgi:hypothetical protein